MKTILILCVWLIFAVNGFCQYPIITVPFGKTFISEGQSRLDPSNTDIKIYRGKYDYSYTTDLDTLENWRDKFQVEGTNYYVSKSGNDTNDGLSWTTAFQTIKQAFLKADAKKQVYVSEGIYDQDDGWSHLNAIGGDVSIYAVGKVSIGNIEFPNSWIVDGSISKQEIMNVGWVLDTTSIGEYGEFEWMDYYNSLNDLNSAIAPSFVYQNDTLYTNAPSKLMVVISNKNTRLVSAAFDTTYVEGDFNFYGTVVVDRNNSNYFSNGANYFFSGKNNPGDSGDLFQSATTYSKIYINNFKAAYAWKDGLNWRDTSIIMELNGVTAYAGLDSVNFYNQVSTGHDGAHITSVNVHYDKAASSLLHDVNATTKRQGYGLTFGTELVPTTEILKKLKLKDDPDVFYDIRSRNSTWMYLENPKPNLDFPFNVERNGTLIIYQSRRFSVFE